MSEKGNPSLETTLNTSGTAHLTVGRGTRRNALGRHGWRELAAAATAIGADPRVRAVVIRGRGADFCAGFDITEWKDAEPAAVDTSFAEMEHAVAAVEALPVPTIAVLRGVAAGAGCQLALACDLRVMATDAAIGMPIVRMGILAPRQFVARILRHVRPEVAGSLLYEGRLVSADEALRVGLVGRVLAAPDLADALDAITATLEHQPIGALRAAKAALASATVDSAPARIVGTADDATFPDAVNDFLNT